MVKITDKTFKASYKSRKKFMKKNRLLFLLLLMPILFFACSEKSLQVSPPSKEKRAPDALSEASVMMKYAGKRLLMSPINTMMRPIENVNAEKYAHIMENPIQQTSENPVSTFSIDVDTGSYSNIRRIIKRGSLPEKDAVRIEELINYFPYDYPLPENIEQPFNIITEIAESPWNKDNYLLRVGIKGFDISKKDIPEANLVFLIDVSGSMNSPDKIELLKSSLKLLLNQLNQKDIITLVVYSGDSEIVLEPTPGDKKAKIANAIDRLTVGGSTNGGSGIRNAYAMAKQSFIKEGINRVMLCTDGDFNVGVVNFNALKNIVEEKRKTGISLTTLGFGAGNYNDMLMEQLADAGNGNYAYIDTINEAQKVLVDEMSSTLQTIAKDVKIQIEFNPEIVAEYRLIGYENRMLNREDFNNDKVDAGEIGAGHTVTAIYELSYVNSKGLKIDPLRYKKEKSNNIVSKSNELAFIRIRFKQPDRNKSEKIEFPIKKDAVIETNKTSESFRFSAAVAAFGQLLRGGTYTGEFSYQDVLKLARESKGKDNFGYRGEFINLVNVVKSLSSSETN